MANALIIKSGGGGLTVKSGGTVTIKDSGQPPYVIPGVTQSHWLAANAVTSDGTTITSIVDSSGTANLMGGFSWYTTGYTPTCAYEPAGWTSGGKTLPSFRVKGASLRSATWATIMSGYNKPVTIATICETVSLLNSGSGASWGAMAALNSTNNADQILWEYYSVRDHQRNSGTSQAGISRLRPSPSNSVGYKRAVVSRWDPSSGWAVWTNGALQTAANSIPFSPPLGSSNFNFFGLGGWSGADGQYMLASDYRFAEFHIYSGALTTAQCAAISADMMTRGGL